jgi:hypothetical protein
MNYKKHYDNLMSSRMLLKISRYNEKKNGIYYEGHHIVPKSKGGSGTSSKGLKNNNIVYLTAREHFLAHWLLWKIYRDRSTALSFHKMFSKNKNQKRIFSSKGYQEAKLAFRETNIGNKYGKGVVRIVSDEQKLKQSKIMKGRYLGKNNPFFGKKHSEETLLKLKKPKSPEHIEKIKKIMINKPKLTCIHCKKETNQLNALKWHFDNCRIKHTKEFHKFLTL